MPKTVDLAVGTQFVVPATGGVGGVVDSIVPGTNVTVDNTNPAHPVVNASGSGQVVAVVAGTNIGVDATNPAQPIVSATGLQPLDADLTAIAALDSSTAGAIGSDGAGWVKKTYAQFKTALSLVKGDVGLGNVDNTSDANKPVSTAQQTALDLKANMVVTITQQAADYTLVLADAGTEVEGTKGTAQVVTIPPHSSVAFPVGTVVNVRQIGAGQITLTAGAGVTLRVPNGAKTAKQYSTATLIQRVSDEWVVGGDTSV